MENQYPQPTEKEKIAIWKWLETLNLETLYTKKGEMYLDADMPAILTAYISHIQGNPVPKA